VADNEQADRTLWTLLRVRTGIEQGQEFAVLHEGVPARFKRSLWRWVADRLATGGMELRRLTMDNPRLRRDSQEGTTVSRPSEVLMSSHYRREDVDSVRRAVRAVDADWPVSASYEMRTGGQPPFVIMIVEFSLAAYFAGLLGKAGADSWPALKKFVTTLWNLENTPDQIVNIDEKGIWIILPKDAPDEAYQRLLEIDAEDVAGDSGSIIWRPDLGEWRSPDQD
jgi:hypothetical protein